ncbi:MAG: FUSC family protein, partial [Verrucomicrobia bacterium]|nr:FUSC family protein [Verrucomicrobiota bacterium]
ELGTLGGSVLASGMLWLQLPFWALSIATAATIFTFGYFIKRNYGVAVFFITLFIVLLTEANGPVTLGFTVERLASTLGGGALALLAAAYFWPVWERDRFPPILAAALRSNRDYLRLLRQRLATGGSYDREATLAKRGAEVANSAVFSSLQRLSGDPRSQRLGLEQSAALANGNQRITRALTVIALHLTPGLPLERRELDEFVRLATEALDALADSIERGEPLHDPLEAVSARLERLRLPLPPTGATDAAARRDHWVFSQLARAGTELGAMLLATLETAPARNADPVPGH